MDDPVADDPSTAVDFLSFPSARLLTSGVYMCRGEGGSLVPLVLALLFYNAVRGNGTAFLLWRVRTLTVDDQVAQAASETGTSSIALGSGQFNYDQCNNCNSLFFRSRRCRFFLFDMVSRKNRVLYCVS